MANVIFSPSIIHLFRCGNLFICRRIILERKQANNDFQRKINTNNKKGKKKKNINDYSNQHHLALCVRGGFCFCCRQSSSCLFSCFSGC